MLYDEAAATAFAAAAHPHHLTTTAENVKVLLASTERKEEEEEEEKEEVLPCAMLGEIVTGIHWFCLFVFLEKWCKLSIVFHAVCRQPKCIPDLPYFMYLVVLYKIAIFSTS